MNGLWTDYLEYTNVCDGAHPHRVDVADDTDYATCKFNVERPAVDGVPSVVSGMAWAASFISTNASIDGFMVQGNLGADGRGGSESNNVTTGPLVGPRGTYGYYKQVYGTSDPSVNHLIIARGTPALDIEVGVTTNSDLHKVLWKGGQVDQMYYVLWAGRQGYKYPVQSVQALLDAVGSSCFDEGSPFDVPDYSKHGGGGGLDVKPELIGAIVGSCVGACVLVACLVTLWRRCLSKAQLPRLPPLPRARTGSSPRRQSSLASQQGNDGSGYTAPVNIPLSTMSGFSPMRAGPDDRRAQIAAAVSASAGPQPLQAQL